MNYWFKYLIVHPYVADFRGHGSVGKTVSICLSFASYLHSHAEPCVLTQHFSLVIKVVPL